jgi:hypothetical protein
MELRYVCLDWFERGKELFPTLKVSGSQLWIMSARMLRHRTKPFTLCYHKQDWKFLDVLECQILSNLGKSNVCPMASQLSIGWDADKCSRRFPGSFEELFGVIVYQSTVTHYH